MTKLMLRCVLFCCMGLVFCLQSCCDSSSSEDDDRYDQSQLLDMYASDYILPRIQQYKEDVLNLQIAWQDYQSNGSEVFADVKQAFLEAYMSYQGVSSFYFGPMSDADILLVDYANTFPSDTVKIGNNIVSEDYNLDAVSQFDATGFPSLDYLFFSLAQSNMLSDRAQDYATDIILQLVRHSDLSLQRWNSGYYDSFLQNTGTGFDASITLLFNAYLVDYEFAKRDKVALPAGYATSFTIPIAKDARKIEARYSGYSWELLKAHIQKSRALFYADASQNGFYGVLKSFNVTSEIGEGIALEEGILQQYDRILMMITSLENEALEELIASDDTRLQELSNAMQKLVPMIKSEMRSYLSIPVTGQDSDGD